MDVCGGAFQEEPRAGANSLRQEGAWLLYRITKPKWLELSEQGRRERQDGRRIMDGHTGHRKIFTGRS